MSEIKVNSIKGVGASAAAVTVHNSDGTCTLASGSKLNNCTTDGTTNLTIADGNLVVGTSGHGIDFSATSGTGTSEILADYEEGTFTPEYNSGSASSACFAAGVSYNSDRTGIYRKIGNMVYFFIKIQATSGTAKSGHLIINGLPFTSGNFTDNATAGGGQITLTNAFNNNSDMPTVFVSGSATQIKFFFTNGGDFGGTNLPTPTGVIHLCGQYPTT